MSTWTGVILGIAAVVATGAATVRWLVGTLTQQMGIVAREVVSEVVGEAVGASEQRLSGRLDAMDARFDAMEARFDAMDARFDAMDARFDAMDRRFDALDAKVDHGTEVTDLRLSHLEADMTLVKQHLLGSTAA